MQKTIQTKKLSEEKLLSIISEMAARITDLEEEISDMKSILEQNNGGK